MATPERFILVDGSNYLFRAFFALQQARGRAAVQLSRSDGMPTGALYVFSAMLMRLYLDERPDHCAVVFDADGHTFRHELDDGYKATRREAPEDLRPQFPFFPRIVEAFRLPLLRVPGVEADDVLATVTRQARERGLDVVIYTGDKDMMQLVDDHVTVVDAMREITYDAARVTEKFGVPPALVADWLALRGDAIDNVPGVEGVGEVTATKLLQEFGSIDGILANTDKLKGKLQQKFRDPAQLERLRISRELTRLRADVPLDQGFLELRRRDWDAKALADLFRELEFAKFLQRLEATFVSDASKYHAVFQEAELAALIEQARAAGRVAIDLRVSSQHAVDLELLGVGLAVPGQPAAYVPVAHRYLGAPAQLPAAAVVARLAPLVADPAVKKTIVNAKIAHLIFPRIEGLEIDPMVASFLLDSSDTNHDLQQMAKNHLSYEVVRVDELCGRGKDAKAWAAVDVEGATRCVAEAVDVAAALGKLLRPRIDGAGLAAVLDDVELPLARILAIMERTGVRVDVGVLRELGHKVGEECRALEKRIQEMAGYPVNVGSPKQLGELLFERLGLKSEKMRKTKIGWSTDAEQLEELLGSHDIVKPILDHRELIKLKGTYLDALPPLVHPKTGRLHTSYNQTGATTGRLASTNPNLQNVPVRTALGREIRRAFVAEAGWVLLSADYSQIELRVLAHLCDDPVLVDAFARNIDVHAQTAAEVFGIPLGEVNAEHRRVAKAVNYGLGYGQSDFGLSRALDIPREDAHKYIETYFQRFARVREYMERTIAEARKTGHVVTLLGRRLATPGIASNRYPDRAAAERLARNYPIQGSAADILKVAMVRVQKLLDEGRFRARMLLTVHDELVFEVPPEEAREFGERARQEMENATILKVPLRVDVGVAESWADAH